MANPEHLEILKQGVKQWNKWRKEHPDLKADFNGADLREAELARTDLSMANLLEANLGGADLSGANLSSANLSSANLTDANLSGGHLWMSDLNKANLGRAHLVQTYLKAATLQGANLSVADLRQANLGGADLNGANLASVDLSWTSLVGADLNGADFSRASAWGTQFADVDLSVAIGLETIEHDGPSTIGIDTIYKSRGKIPEVFLRGCGVPDEFIVFIRRMGVRPVEFYSCFISYSTKDEDFAKGLYADLQAKGVRCWFAAHDIKGGRKIHEQIDEAIRLHDRLLLILSEHSMSSEWVKTEITKAHKREVKDDKRVLFPVRLVSYEAMQSWEYIDSTGKDLAEEIRQYLIPDFSNWKDHDSYQTAFQRLVKDLKAEASK